MEKVKRALLGDRKAQAELTRQGRKLPCHVCGKKAEIMFREGLFVIMCSDEYCNCLCVAEPVRSMEYGNDQVDEICERIENFETWQPEDIFTGR